jgi:hypothetical protein
MLIRALFSPKGRQECLKVQLAVNSARSAFRNIGEAVVRLLLTLALLAAAGCSSVSICVEQEKGVSANDDLGGVLSRISVDTSADKK